MTTMPTATADTVVPAAKGDAALSVSLAGTAPSLRLTSPAASPDGDAATRRDVLSLNLSQLGDPASVRHSVRPDGQHVFSFADTRAELSVSAHGTSFTFSVTAPQVDLVQADFDLTAASWFGFGHLMNHLWPLNESALLLSPAFPFDNCPTGLSTLLDLTFVTASGALMTVHDDSPGLHVGINSPIPHTARMVSPYVWTVGLDALHMNREVLPRRTEVASPRMLTFQSRQAYDHSHLKHSWSEHVHKRNPTLTFTVSASANVKQAVLKSLNHVRTTYGHAPCGEAKLKMMQAPIWSTWVKFKRDITQDKIVSFAREIIDRGFSGNVMGIDDKWSIRYGEIAFDPVKFPNPKVMVDELHRLGFLVTLWVTPFANMDAAQLKDPAIRQYYVHMPDGELGQFKWWQPGAACALDVTNPQACEWFVVQLQRLCTEYGIDGFKFDAGEPCFVASGSTILDTLETPNDYTCDWIHNVVSRFELAECRSAVRGCQSGTPMFRIFDKYSTWGLGNGLSSVLPAILTSGILGFPFCLPDYIAGNAYGDEVPESELFVRWTQVSVAMAALQFSIPPWFFDDGVCGPAVQKALRWRELVFWSHVKECVDDASERLWPIVRPMWWEEPELQGIDKIYDQFMVGENIVVAPILQKGQRERSVFLPRGSWQKIDPSTCKPTGPVLSGPQTIENVSAPLDEMLFYVRAGSAGDS